MCIVQAIRPVIQWQTTCTYMRSLDNINGKQIVDKFVIMFMLWISNCNQYFRKRPRPCRFWKMFYSCLLCGSTRVLAILSVHLQHIYLLLGSPVTGNCSSGRLYAVQFQEIPGIQHVDGCFPIQVTMVRVRVGRLFKVKCTWSTVCMYILYTKYVRVEEWKSIYVRTCSVK